ncbi:LEF-5 [Macrobrachium rosenbergii nudivirus]|nr:LEF-5 [Macrobrachium rosenbergii nudivirus]
MKLLKWLNLLLLIKFNFFRLLIMEVSDDEIFESSDYEDTAKFTASDNETIPEEEEEDDDDDEEEEEDDDDDEDEDDDEDDDGGEGSSSSTTSSNKRPLNNKNKAVRNKRKRQAEENTLLQLDKLSVIFKPSEYVKKHIHVDDKSMVVLLDNLAISVPIIYAKDVMGELKKCPKYTSSKYICKHEFHNESRQTRCSDEAFGVLYICVKCGYTKTM